MKKKLLIIVTFYVCYSCMFNLWAAFGADDIRKEWPVVKQLQKRFLFEDASNATVKFDIVGIDGKPLYTIECHTFNYYDPDFDYSGDFECRLKSLYSKEVYSTLFTDNPKQSRDWQSRGRFLVQEIVGKCADYPEYGRVRHFMLRGMEITLAIRNPKFGENVGVKKGRPELKSFEFDIEVKTEPRATRPIAETVPYVAPPFLNPKDPNDFTLDCETILKKKKKEK